MSGFGNMPFGSGPYGASFAAPSPGTVINFVSSRRRDALGHLVQRTDGSGDFEGMNDTIQRAENMLAVTIKPTGYITADYAATQEAAVREALKPLTEVEKSLSLDAASAFDNGAARTGITATLRDIAEDGIVKRYTRP